ncbi:MAG: creatininase family protein [Trueperaceae bacterium]|nr:creatininase family protein [Trueperaceae bacterium]
MKIRDMHWQHVEEYLENDDRCILPLGSVEQHAFLSLAVDAILSERVAVDAAEPVGVPVFPALPYGLAPYFQAYPGSMTLRVDTYVRVVRELLDGLRRSGFRRVLIVNGHGGNAPAGALAQEYSVDHPEMRVKFHSWWSAPRVAAETQRIDPAGSHASWSENFPWTRLEGVTLPDHRKGALDLDLLRVLDPAGVREYVGDGNYGGEYQKDDATMHGLWSVAVEETRAMLDGPWGL